MRKKLGKILCVSLASCVVFAGAFSLGSILSVKTALADEEDAADDDDADDDDDEFEVELEDCEVTFDEKKFYYTGKAIKPEITVTYYDEDGEEADLEEGEDYKITYSNNVKVSKNACLKIIGISDTCTGSITKKFAISKAPQKISAKKAKIKLAKSTYKINAKLIKGDGKLSYISSNKAVATVDNKGKLTLKKKGKVTVTIKAKGSKNYKTTKKKIVVNVK